MNKKRQYGMIEVGLTTDGENFRVDTYDGESGASYRLEFNRFTDNKRDMLIRIGEEIYSWIELMNDYIEDEVDEDDSEL